MIPQISDPRWKRIIGNPNAFKNMTAVHCLHKHFPDHEYYIWLDCDQWIQSELILDQQISLCEKQLIAGSYIRIPDRHLQICWKNVLSSSYLKTLIGKPCITGGFWIAHREFLKLYNHEMNTHIQQTEHYTYGSNDSMLSYTLHKYVKNAAVFRDEYLWPYRPEKPVYIDEDKNLKVDNHFVRMLCVDFYGASKNPLSYRYIMPNTTLQSTKKSTKLSENLMSQSASNLEEDTYKLCVANGWQQGNYCYRIYPKPEILHGEMKKWL